MDRRITVSIKKILDERLKYHRKNPEEGKSWDEVRRGVKKKFGI